jgi:hypothetical protein
LAEVKAIPTTAKAGRRKFFIVIEFLLYWTDMRLKSFEAIKAYVPLYAAFATLPSRKNANPIIRTHFRPFA